MALHEALNAAGRVPGPIVKSIAAGDINVTRTYSDRFDLDVAPAIPCTDAFGVIVQLRDFDTHRLWRRGQLVYEGGHPKASLAITDLRDQWQCHHLSPFDNIRFHIPFSRMRAFAEEVGRSEYMALACVQGRIDPVMHGLAQALLPSLDNPNKANPLFLEQINLAMLAHLSQTYGGCTSPWTKKDSVALAGKTRYGLFGFPFQQTVLDWRSGFSLRIIAQLFQQGVQGELWAHPFKVADRVPGRAGQGNVVVGPVDC